MKWKISKQNIRRDCTNKVVHSYWMMSMYNTFLTAFSQWNLRTGQQTPRQHQCQRTLLLHHAFVSVSLTSCSWSRTLLKSRSQLALARSAGSSASSSFATLRSTQKREVLLLNIISHFTSQLELTSYSALALIILSMSSSQCLLCFYYHICVRL